MGLDQIIPLARVRWRTCRGGFSVRCHRDKRKQCGAVVTARSGAAVPGMAPGRSGPVPVLQVNKQSPDTMGSQM